MQPSAHPLTTDDLARLAERAGLEKPAIVVQALDAPWGGAALRSDRPLYPASMIKVPLVAAALVLRAAGSLGPEPIPVATANMTANDGPSPLAAGYEASLEELCALAIERSDNVATNQLFDVVGRVRGGRIAREHLGLHDTGFRRKLSGTHPLVRDDAQTGRNTFPARDAATLFTAIANSAFPGANDLYRMLERQMWNTKLSTGLRAGDTFAHKTGDTETVSHDGGILATADGRRYVVVVYTACASTEATDARFGAFMRDLREMLEEAGETLTT